MTFKVYRYMGFGVVKYLCVLYPMRCTARQNIKSGENLHCRRKTGKRRECKRFFSDTAKYGKYAIYSAKSALKSEVANSYLNWLWWVLDPLCFMLIYTFIFGVVFNGAKPYFPIFIFIGITVWDFFHGR